MAEDKTNAKTQNKANDSGSKLDAVKFTYRQSNPLVCNKDDNTKRVVIFQLRGGGSAFSRAGKEVTLEQLEAKPVYYLRLNPDLVVHTNATKTQMEEIKKISVADALKMYK